MSFGGGVDLHSFCKIKCEFPCQLLIRDRFIINGCHGIRNRSFPHDCHFQRIGTINREYSSRNNEPVILQFVSRVTMEAALFCDVFQVLLINYMVLLANCAKFHHKGTIMLKRNKKSTRKCTRKIFRQHVFNGLLVGLSYGVYYGFLKCKIYYQDQLY